MSESNPLPLAARRRFGARLAQLLGCLAALPLAACSFASTQMEIRTVDASTSHDFDFLAGRWRVRHRRLRERLAGSDDWQEFDGTCFNQPILGGIGNVDDNLIELPAGPYHGAGLRAFDAPSRRWAIWWLDARYPQALDAPVVGGFERGTGTFYADDTFNGRPIRVRFRWTDTLTPSPRWEQAFSVDGGASWEINWTMVFVRVGAAP